MTPHGRFVKPYLSLQSGLGVCKKKRWRRPYPTGTPIFVLRVLPRERMFIARITTTSHCRQLHNNPTLCGV
ncbi:hypothetical protein CSUI_006754, partial [Cystoisospora suis]